MTTAETDESNEERQEDESSTTPLQVLAHEINELLDESEGGEIILDHFPETYRSKFGKTFAVSSSRKTKLKVALESLSQTSPDFKVELRGINSYWVVRTSPKNQVVEQAPSSPLKTKTTENQGCSLADVYELTKAAGGKLYVGEFRKAYQARFGKQPFPQGTKVKKALSELLRSKSKKKFKLTNLNKDGTSFWITV